MTFCSRPLAAVCLSCLVAGWGAGAARAASAAIEIGRPVVRHYAPGEHLRGLSSQRVFQDTTGTMVFANDVGLLFFDGLRWTYAELPTESAGVRQFAMTADGTIFMAGAGVLGYLRGAGASARFVSLAGQLPPGAANVDELCGAVAIGRTVYFSDDEKILIWRDGRFTVLPYPSPPAGHGARLHRVGQTLYITALGHGLAQLEQDKIEPVADDPVLRENQIISVEAGAAGSLVLLTAEHGFFEVRADGSVAPLATGANRWLAGRRVFCALRLADGSRVVGFSSVSGDGGMRFDAAGRYAGPIDTTIGLLTKDVRDFFQDGEGGLWLGLGTGAARLEWPSAVSVFDVVNGLGEGVVADVVRHEGVLYAATSEGLFRLRPADASGRPAHFERLLKHPVSALASQAGSLLVLGSDGLLVASPSGFIPVGRGPEDAGVLLASRRDPNLVWLGTNQGLRSFRHGPGGWSDVGAVAGFVENCRALAESADGALWVATPDHGLFRLTFSGAGAAPRVEALVGGNGLPAPPGPTGVAEWGGQAIFTSAKSPAVFSWEPRSGRFSPLAGTTTLPADLADDRRVAGGGADALWLAGPGGIYRVGRHGGTQRLPNLVPATVGAVQNLREEAGPDGPVLWVCGANGLARVEVARAFPVPVPFATRLTDANVREGDRLPPEPPLVTFRYVAPRQRPTSPVVYRSRLRGLERDWSGWSPQRERTYPRLPSGRYLFEVQARDADGVVAAPATRAFAVLPPWWMTWWALTVYAMAGLGLIDGVVHFRTRALRQRADHLETVVADRTAELARKNTELVRLNRLELDEKLSARLAEEKARLEVLRYQLNPHFLFNTLASISAALPARGSKARAMVERLAEFCRLTLHRPDAGDWTTLGEEMKVLRTYLEIERSRWGDLLDAAVDCDPALLTRPLPHFLLLPLVENALKYGRATSPDRVGLRLGARGGEAGELVLTVANTGKWVAPGAPKPVAGLGIGLDNLRERLARHYPRAHRLEIAAADGWVTVVLRIFPPSV